MCRFASCDHCGPTPRNTGQLCPLLGAQGQYDKAESFQELNSRMSEVEVASGKQRANRMFFLSIPPNVFIPAAGGAADYCSTK
jgi:glucose-6-phosphate 1-dehydrogenase